MLRRFQRGMEKWGHYLLALLCAGVILLSAVWTRRQDAENAGQTALSDQGQRLSQALETPEPAPLVRPAAGAVARGFSIMPVFFPKTGVWMAHSGLDFAAEPGEKVFALAAGTVVSCEGGIRVDHGDGRESLYRGVQESGVRPGQRVRAGETLGTAGGAVLYEGEGHVCVILYKNGVPVLFGNGW